MCEYVKWNSFRIGIVFSSETVVSVVQIGGIDPVFDVGNIPASRVESAESELNVLHSSSSCEV